ncbi:MAG TPA: GlsB/YeaQ/YmgE family stress response membrane protein [Candidatus Limnocylindria bacterium]
MIFLAIIVIGMVAGWIANRVVGARRGFTPLELLLVGLAGSVVGGTLFSVLLGEGFELRPGGFIGASIGAILLLAVYGPVRDRMGKTAS